MELGRRQHLIILPFEWDYRDIPLAHGSEAQCVDTVICDSN
jgi:hypothetical protein